MESCELGGAALKLLVWHWGRRGAGPLFAAKLAEAFGALPGCEAGLSLAAGAEILAGPDAPSCDWREPTYASPAGFAAQWLQGPMAAGRIDRQLAAISPDIAICAMPALLDRRMTAALKRRKIPYAVIVHDAAGHPGETLKFWLLGQTRLLRGATTLFALSEHVETMLRTQNLPANIIKLWHPPFTFGEPALPPLAHGGRPRLLFFGRLLPYKGLDLLADALAALGDNLPYDIAICGDGPNSHELDRLKSTPHVTVDHRWIPESELPHLIAWSDAIVLPYREASQSGVAAAAIAQGRYILATNVGGLPEQLAHTQNATLCNPTAPALATALATLFNNPPVGPVPADPGTSWARFAAAMREGLEGGLSK
jgi:glycosyltransferase involved in cell wall biosynthesis